MIGATAARKTVGVWRADGMHGVAQRAVRAAYRRLDAAALEFPLLRDDVADSRRLDLPAGPRRPRDGRSLRIGFLATPPGIGSGGHTTMFRMVTALEHAGHDCTLFLYDRYGGDVHAHAARIRRGWPAVRARVRDAGDELGRVDACVATSWETAHVLASRGRAPMRRLYLVQDFEPFFYGRGAEYALAEDSYRFGFRCLAVGHMVAGLLRSEVGVDADVLEFGCDTDVYKVTSTARRTGVVFYGKPGAARRGYPLGVLALQLLRERRPDIPIHVVGEADGRVPFESVAHGTLSPLELSGLYNEVCTGLALSFTNISLVAEELLACGVVPVVNDSALARADLRAGSIRWAPPTPYGIADALIAVCDAPPDPARVAAGARTEVWRPAQRAFVHAIEDELYEA